MEKLGLYLLLFFTLYNAVSTAKTAAASPTASDFIKASCRATRYPALCIQCLSTYAKLIQQSDHQLAHAALSVSLAKARSTTMFVSRMKKFAGIKPREYQAVKDCIDNMGDSVDQLSKSIQELAKMGRARGQDFIWHMGNVQTWVSAALTNENTCVDGFAGSYMEGNVKVAIRRRVVSVAQVTSNALALVNRFAVRHRAAEITRTP